MVTSSIRSQRRQHAERDVDPRRPSSSALASESRCWSRPVRRGPTRSAPSPSPRGSPPRRTPPWPPWWWMATPMTPEPLPTTLLPVEDLSTADIDEHRRFTFQFGTPINPTETGSGSTARYSMANRDDAVVRLDTIEEWVIRNVVEQLASVPHPHQRLSGRRGQWAADARALPRGHDGHPALRRVHDADAVPSTFRAAGSSTATSWCTRTTA